MYLLLGQMHLQRERYEPALAVLRKALAKSKPEQRGSVQLLIGVAQLGSDRLDDAERAFQAAANDAKVGDAARSYLKFVEEQRRRKRTRIPCCSNHRPALIEFSFFRHHAVTDPAAESPMPRRRI
jgi:tetratricopeptide (TPR) repeat protein